MRIPIDRWIQSKAGRDPVDQMIDLGIALEALYVPERGGDLTYKLSPFVPHGTWEKIKNVARNCWKSLSKYTIAVPMPFIAANLTNRVSLVRSVFLYQTLLIELRIYVGNQSRKSWKMETFLIGTV